MITAEDIGYEVELQENTSIERIRNVYKDGIIIWVNGSGTSPGGKTGTYRCVLEYQGKTIYIEDNLPGATANQVMIIGATEAIKHVTKPMKLYLVAPTALGFVKGFKGNGINSSLIQELCKTVHAKACQLTEVQFLDGADAIKEFIFSCNSDKKQLEAYERKKEDKKNIYKEIIYNECLTQVIQILKTNNVDAMVLEKIAKIKS